MPRIVPRVVVELERAHEYSAMLTGLKADVIKVLARECKRSRVDGLVTPAEPMLSKQAELEILAEGQYAYSARPGVQASRGI